MAPTPGKSKQTHQKQTALFAKEHPHVSLS